MKNIFDIFSWSVDADSKGCTCTVKVLVCTVTVILWVNVTSWLCVNGLSPIGKYSTVSSQSCYCEKSVSIIYADERVQISFRVRNYFFNFSCGILMLHLKGMTLSDTAQKMLDNSFNTLFLVVDK